MHFEHYNGILIATVGKVLFTMSEKTDLKLLFSYRLRTFFKKILFFKKSSI